MVEPDQDAVEAALTGGRLACDCGGELRPWAHARRRTLRDGPRLVRLRPRRARCSTCRVTHVLLPTIALLRRRDLAAVIGEALRSRHVEGLSRAAIAERAGVLPDTARGWLRRFAERAEDIRASFATVIGAYVAVDVQDPHGLGMGANVMAGQAHHQCIGSSKAGQDLHASAHGAYLRRPVQAKQAAQANGVDAGEALGSGLT